MIVHEKTNVSFIFCFHASVPHIDLYCCPNSRADYYVKGFCKRQTKHWQCLKWYRWLFLKQTKKAEQPLGVCLRLLLCSGVNGYFRIHFLENNGERWQLFILSKYLYRNSYPSQWLCWNLRPFQIWHSDSASRL